MDLAALCAHLTPAEQDTLLRTLNTGVTHASREDRYAANRLYCRIQSALRPVPLDPHTRDILGWLFSAPHGLNLLGINATVLEVLEAQGCITYNGHAWRITRDAASLFHRLGHAESVIREAQPA